MKLYSFSCAMYSEKKKKTNWWIHLNTSPTIIQKWIYIDNFFITQWTNSSETAANKSCSLCNKTNINIYMKRINSNDDIFSPISGFCLHFLYPCLPFSIFGLHLLYYYHCFLNNNTKDKGSILMKRLSFHFSLIFIFFLYLRNCFNVYFNKNGWFHVLQAMLDVKNEIVHTKAHAMSEIIPMCLFIFINIWNQQRKNR